MGYLKFWGVRGSIPTPGPSTMRYGGNTSCLEIQCDDKLLILDAGSGLRNLGNALMGKGQAIQAHVFITHMHWDHIQGIPFFTPAYIPGNSITFLGADEADRSLQSIISGQMDPTYFPIELDDMGAELNFRNLSEDTYTINDIRFETLYVNHPGNALGYKFYLKDTSVVYISDNEPFDTSAVASEEMLGEDGNQKLIDFVKDCDILIHDAQYTQEEYEKHRTWGHSPFTFTVDVALQANVGQLVLFHHDPLHDDNAVDTILESARQRVHNSDKSLNIIAAQEGLEIAL